MSLAILEGVRLRSLLKMRTKISVTMERLRKFPKRTQLKTQP
jgi:hypothetical protein